MIIRVHYKSGQALVSVPPNTFVYDGKSYLPPEQAKFVALIYDTTVSADVKTPGQFLSRMLTWKNQLICKVIGIESNEVRMDDLVTSPIPAGWAQLQAIGSVGVEYQRIQVYSEVPNIADINPGDAATIATWAGASYTGIVYALAGTVCRVPRPSYTDYPVVVVYDSQGNEISIAFKLEGDWILFESDVSLSGTFVRVV